MCITVGTAQPGGVHVFPLVHDAPIRPPILPQSLSPPSMAKTGPASKNGKATPIFCFRQRVTITSGYGYRYINIPAAESPPAPPTFDSRWPWPVRRVRGARKGQSPSRVLEQADQGAVQGQAGWLWCCLRRKKGPRHKPRPRAGGPGTSGVNLVSEVQDGAKAQAAS